MLAGKILDAGFRPLDTGEEQSEKCVKIFLSQRRRQVFPYALQIDRRASPIRANKWFVAMATTVPPSGRDRGQRKRANEEGLVPSILQPDEPSKGCRKNWARLTRLWRVYPPLEGLYRKSEPVPDLTREGRPPHLPTCLPRRRRQASIPSAYLPSAYLPSVYLPE